MWSHASAILILTCCPIECTLASCYGHGMRTLQSPRWTQEALLVVGHLGVTDRCALCLDVNWDAFCILGVGRF